MEENALKYDHEDEDDDQDHEDGEDECQKRFDLAQQKKIAVFNELKRLSFLPPDDQMDSSELYHGVSAKLVKQARKQKLHNDALMSFEHFENSILEKLESSLRKQVKRELSVLLSAQEMFLTTAVDAQRDMDVKSTKMKDDIHRFKETEQAIFTMIEQVIDRDASIVKAVGHDLEKLSAILLKEAEGFKYTTKGSSNAKLAEEFSREIKGSILDRSFNVLRQSFRRALQASLVDSVLITELNTLLNPLIRRLFQRAMVDSEDTSLPREDSLGKFVVSKAVALGDVISSVSKDVDTLLRSRLNTQIDTFDITKTYTTRPMPNDRLWRRKVVQDILSKIDIKQLTDEVILACQKRLVNKRKKINDMITTIELLIGLSGNTKIAGYLPQIAHLAVRGHSLRYVIERGVPELGQELQNTAHGRLFSCSSPYWVVGCGSSMVKVVNKNGVKDAFWDQTMRDCMHFK